MRLGLSVQALLAVAILSAVSPASAAPRDAVRAEATAPGVPADVAAFYRARGERPLWIHSGRLRPEATRLADVISGAWRDGLAPERYGAAELNAALAAARNGGARPLARAEVLLTEALASYAADLHRPPRGAAMVLTDAALPVPIDRRGVLASIGDGQALGSRITALLQMHPVYDALRSALADYQAEWSSLPEIRIPSGPALRSGARGPRVALLRRRLALPDADEFDPATAEKVRAFQVVHGLPATGRADAVTIAALNRGPESYERTLRLNLERARALPGQPGERHILVDAGGAELWLYEGRRAVDSMKVIVGKPSSPTPLMAGVIRYAVVNPYWNIPEDLVRTSLSRRMIKQGSRQFAKERLEALSDWTESATVVDPTRIDWRDVAAGRTALRVRQKPGSGNVMGRIKFMLPNRLGVYLHDTPNKAPFARGDRFLSSGCVRLQDAARLGRWLQDGRTPAGSNPEQRVDLKRPTPVYITYFTVAIGADGRAIFRPDVYGRDKPMQTATVSRP
jgi:murein L,D-transpeptidase YcbB/YkuD